MYTDPDEAAYCITRIARSTALAAVSTDSCARASHLGIAEGYEERLTSLIREAEWQARPGKTPMRSALDA